jgi:hypothetical protein
MSGSDFVIQIRTICLFLLIAAAIASLYACSEEKNNDPAAYHDTLMTAQIRSAKLLELRISKLPAGNEEISALQFDNFLEVERSKIRKWGHFNQDSSLLNAIDSCLKTYQNLGRRQIPELEKLLHKPRQEFSKADEARLEFLYREIGLLTEKSFQQVNAAGKVFHGKHILNSTHNVPLRP